MAVAFSENPGSWRKPRPNDAHASARVVWAAMIEGRSHATRASLAGDLALFGRFTWGVRRETAVIRHAIELARAGSAEFRSVALAFAEHERARGAAAASVERRWRTLAALARALAVVWPDAPKLELGAPPSERAPRLDAAARARLVAELAERGNVRDAAIVALVSTTTLTAAAIVALRVADLRTFAGGEHVRAVMVAYARGRDGRALAFPGRTRGRAMAATSVDRVCERWGTSVAALRCDQRETK